MINLTVGVKAKKSSLKKAAFWSVLLVHHRDTDPPVSRVFGIVWVVGRCIGHAFNLGKSAIGYAFFANDLASFFGTLGRQSPVVFAVRVGKFHTVGMAPNGNFVGRGG